MNRIKQEQVALFRYGLIFPLLDERLERGDKTRLMKEIAFREYDIPFSPRKRVTVSTLYLWLNAYKKRRSIEDLFPQIRQDKGSSRTLSSETELALRAFRELHPQDPLTTFVKKAVAANIFLPHEQVTMPTIYRLFKDYELEKKALRTKDMRRFSMESCNDCWMLDAMVGPQVYLEENGTKRLVKAKLFALIDDKSRLITYAQFYKDEKAESLMDCLWNAFNARGLPRKIFTDNGSAMRDGRLKLGCAALEVHLSFAKAYAPTSKAKIERFFLTVRMQFLPMLPAEPLTLYALNKRWQQYVHEYNGRHHSGIGMAPLACYLEDVQAIRPAPNNLPKHFRARETRKVSLARTISLDNVLYEVPLGYAGRTIELRYLTLDSIEAFCDGTSIGYVKPVDLVANSRAVRQGDR